MKKQTKNKYNKQRVIIKIYIEIKNAIASFVSAAFNKQKNK